MSLTRWFVCALASMMSFGLVVAAAEEKKEEKKVEKKKEEKKEEKKDEKKPVTLSAVVKSAFDARYKGAEILEAKDKKDSLEIKAKDSLNESFKVVYGADGKLWSESARKVSMANVPAAVTDTAKKWAPGAKWGDTATVETKKAEPTKWEVVAMLGEKKLKADIAEDGKVIKADKLPEAKVEKHEEKKEEKKEKKEDKKETKKA
jgi:hypothetical protein